MYKIQRLNVVRMTDDENKKDKYITQGFKLIEEEPVKDEKENNYSKMTVPELQTLCKDNGLDGYSDLKKDELVKFIKDNLKK